jgi:predicted transposase YbfD/YdcC
LVSPASCSPPTPCTVKKTFEAARDTGNFLLVQVKANQQILLEKIGELCVVSRPLDAISTKGRIRHGRQEHRTVETFDAASRLGADWDGLITTAIRVERLTWHKDTKSGNWLKTNEVSFYASQIGLSAKAAEAAIRGHWGIENRNHYVRDVTLGEDQSRIRNKPAHFARLRSIALNILRANGASNIARELFINALNPDHALAYALS